MVILELAAQGLKGFAPSVRISFSQGYTLLQAQQAGGSLWRLLEALCYADVQADTSSLVASGASVGRAGLTFQGRDGETYRLVRELGGSGTLAKLDPGTGKFLAVTTDGAEMAQYLRASVGLPTRGVYEQAFAIVPGTWPSQRVNRPVSNPGLGRSTGSFPALQPSTALGLAGGRSAAQPAADVPAAQALLAQLRAEFEGAKEIDALQFKLDGLQKRVFDLSAQVRQVDELRRQAEHAHAAVAQMRSPSELGLPENIAERAARFESAEKQRDDKLLRIEAEREKFLGQSFVVEPLYREPPFLAGVGLGVLALAAGLALGPGWHALCLLDIPAFGLAAVWAIRWVGELQASESLVRRRSHYDEREKSVKDAFENEVLSVKSAMKVLNVSAPGELIELFAQRQLLERQLADASAQLASLEADPAVAEAQRGVAEAQAEQAQIDARLSELAGFGRPVHVVESEIDEVEASIRAAQRPASSAVAPAATPDALGSAAPAATAQLPAAGADPVPALLDATADLFASDLAALGASVIPRAAQYLAALTEQRLPAMAANAKGEVTVQTAGGPVGAGALQSLDRDLLYLAVKLALMEKYAERAKLPYVIDDDFSMFPAPTVALIGRLLKHLGTRAQVLHLTASAATEALADTRFAV